MELPRQTQHAIYATAGAGEWLWNTIRDGADRVGQSWRNRDQWPERTEQTYGDLVDRGQSLLTRTGRQARQQARRAQDASRRVPGVASIEGEVTGLASDADDLPISDYNTLTVNQITAQLGGLSQRQLHQIEGYEARHQNRSTVLQRVSELRGSEPWPGYDEMNVDEILPRLRELAPDERAAVATYEQHHKQRTTVIATANTTAEQ